MEGLWMVQSFTKTMIHKKSKSSSYPVGPMRRMVTLKSVSSMKYFQRFNAKGSAMGK